MSTSHSLYALLVSLPWCPISEARSEVEVLKMLAPCK